MVSQSEFYICMSSTLVSPLPHSPDLWLISSFPWFASNPSLTLASLFFVTFDPCLIKSVLLLFKYGEANRSKEDFHCKQSLLLKDPERRDISRCAGPHGRSTRVGGGGQRVQGENVGSSL